MNRFRLAAIDLDGTLLRSDGSLSDHSRRAVADAQESGIEIVLVTARHIAAIDRFVDKLELVGEAICCTGAAICDLPSKRISWSEPIMPETAVEVANRITACCPTAHLGWVHESGVLGFEPGYPPPLPIGKHRYVDPSEIAEPVLKMWVLGPRLVGDWPTVVADATRGLIDIGHYGRDLVDLVAPGVTKVDTLRKLCLARGVQSDQVIAFGDTTADLAMLRWSGHGVIMANARQELWDSADEIAPPCDEDGVAAVLDRLVRRLEHR